MEAEKRNPLGYEKPAILLRQFAIPSVASMLITSLYNLVDQIFIGQKVGLLGNAATNVAYPLTTICLAISLLIGIGSASKFSLELGAGEKKEAEHCVGNAFWMSVVLGIFYSILIELFLPSLLHAFGATDSVFPYAESYVRITAIGMPFLIFTNVMSNLIRADGSPKYSMSCMMIGAIVNTILDPLFMFGFGMGVEGAALATVISQIISFVFAFGYLWKFKQVKLGKEFFHPQLKRCIKIASLGASNSLNQIAITLVQIVMNNSLTYYGALSAYGKEIPLSSFGIIMKVNSIFISIFVGISQGSQPIVGYNYGAKQYDRVKEVYSLAIKCSFVVSTIAFILFQFFTKNVISLFGSGDELYFEFATMFMRTFLFMIIVNGVQVISSNVFSALGMPLKGTLLSLSRQFIFLVPLILILPIFFGVTGIMYSAPISDTIAFIITAILVKREFKIMEKMKTDM